MKVAVTGASGFVGRHVLQSLARRRVDLRAVSRREQRPFDSTTWSRFDIAEEVTNPLEKLGSPDVLFHLAWDGLPNYRSPRHLAEELPKQVRFIDSLAASGLRRIAVAGTCLEYGLAEGCLDEETPAAPTTEYGKAKLELHRHLLTVGERLGIAVTWFRLFYLYGSGQAVGSLLPQIDAAVAQERASFDMSPGDQTRDFVAAEEAAELMVSVALNHPRAGTVNVCSGRPLAVVDLARQRLASLGSSMKLNLGALPYPDYEPRHAWGSRRKLDALLARVS